MRQELDQLLDEATARSPDAVGRSATATAIQAAVWRDGTWLYRGTHGVRRIDPLRPVEDDTPFDLASLTKPIAAATLAMQAVGEARIEWRDPVGEHLDGWPSSDEHPKADVTILQLLNHTSGLPDWRPFHEDYPFEPGEARAERTRRRILDAIADTDLLDRPGRTECYSDLGYIVLAPVLERALGRPFPRLVESRVVEPLGLDSLAFSLAWEPRGDLETAAVTEDQPERGGPLVGRVHDRNASVLGGASGHAGLFGTATDVARFGRHLLEVEAGDADRPIVPPAALDFAWSDRARGGTGHHLAGWDTPSGDRSSAGRGFSAGRTVGHLGFTGTSIWIERRTRTVAVLLTNRVFPTRDNDRIDDLRIAFHETVIPPPDAE